MNELEFIDKSMPVFSISVAAKLLDISVHTLRMYEREKLIIPFREEGKNRLYSRNDLDRIVCIRDSMSEKKFTIPAIKTILSFIPCWKILGCSQQDRDNCEAFKQIDMPCWSYKHKNNYCAQMKCKNCDVYNNFIQCIDIKTKVNELLNVEYSNS